MTVLSRLAILSSFFSWLGCTAVSGDSEPVAAQSAPLFSNGGFESGDFTSWTKTTALNNTGLLLVPPQSIADLALTAGGKDFSFARTNAVPESQLSIKLPAHRS